MGEAYSTHDREEKCVQNFFVGKSEGKRPVGRSRCRWEDNVTMGLTEIWWEIVDWIHVIQDGDQCLALCDYGNVQSGSIKGGEFLDYLSDWSRDSLVGMALSYGLDDRGSRVRMPAGAGNSPPRPERLWGPPSLLPNGYQMLFPWGKAAGA
jgi:hypothetical protein